MSAGFDSKLGAQLWALLPEVYRSRDNGDLRDYLDASGEVLDLVRELLEQRLADAFPDPLSDGQRTGQSWLLPYFAALLDVRMVSPDDAGRREEVARAVGWRKRKGTLGCAEEIARVLGRFGWEIPATASEEEKKHAPWATVAIQEGWKRVARTPRVGMRLLHERVYGALPGPAMDEVSPGIYPRIYRHAGLPVATVDFRYRSQRVLHEQRTWQANPHGVPVEPGSFDDVTHRTPDFRKPSWKAGHIHPGRVLVHALPHAGFFPPGWEQQGTPVSPDEVVMTGKICVLEGKRIEAPLSPATASSVLTVVDAQLVMRRCVIRGDVELGPTDGEHLLEDSIIDGKLVCHGRVKLVRCAVRELEAPEMQTDITAANSLFARLLNMGGTVKLVGVTVLELLAARRCMASDSLLASGFDIDGLHGEAGHCFRYTRVNPDLPIYIEMVKNFQNPPSVVENITTDRPRFWSAVFGAQGAGVLHPGAPESLRSGAEDGGELGAYGHRFHILRERAVIEKLNGHLPLGQRPVVIPDPRLELVPPSVEDPNDENLP